jgi:hypothetical protein
MVHESGIWNAFFGGSLHSSGERSERGNGGDHGHVDGEPVRVGHRDRDGEPEFGFVVR